MATIDRYKIVLDVDGQQAVDRLRNSVTSLGTTIAGLAFGGFIAGAFKMADAMKDVADATGLAIGSVKALALSLEEAGGSFDDAGKVINTFYGNLESAATGTEKIQNSLAKVGIGLNELRNLSEQQLLTRAIDELSKMEAGAARTALGVELFGKSFKSVDPKALQEALSTKDVEKLQQEMMKASDAIGAMEANFRTLQEATLNLLVPIIGDVDNLKLSAEQADKIIKVVGGALLLAFGASVAGLIKDVVLAVRALTTALKGTAIAQAAVMALSGPKGWAVLAGSAAAAGAAVYGLNKLLEENAEAQEKVKDSAAGAGRGFINPPMVGGGGRGAFPNAQQFTDQELQARKQAVVAAQQLTNEMRAQNNEALKLRDLTISLIGEESNYANLVKSNAQVQADGAKQIRDLESKIVAEKEKGRGTNQQVIAQYQAQINLIRQQTTAQQELNQKEYDRIQLIKDTKSLMETHRALDDLNMELQAMDARLKLINMSSDAQKIYNGVLNNAYSLAKSISNIGQQAISLVDPTDVNKINQLKQGLLDYQLLSQQIQTQVRNGEMTEEQASAKRIENAQKLYQFVQTGQQGELSRLLSLMDYDTIRHDKLMEYIKAETAAQRARQSELEIKQISASDQASLDAMSRRLELIGLYGDQLDMATSKLQIEEELQNRLLAIEKQRMALGAQATQAELDHLAQLERAARDYADKRTQIEQQRMEREKAVQQSAEKGIEAAMAQIEKMNTPFNRAQQATTALFNNMNNAIDNFVKTGKFSFKDFARSVIQDILAIELKAQATKLLGSLLGKGGSIFDLFAGMFKAEGGPVDKNSPYIVGEKGPELFVPSSSGKIISNGQTMGMARPSAPAQVSAPINNTYITNNISAVDAKSVAQLFAENRKTLLGTVEMARKELPYATR